MDRTERRLRQREAAIRAEIDRRRSTSQRQADVATGRNRDDGGDRPAGGAARSNSERQARAALGQEA